MSSYEWPPSGGSGSITSVGLADGSNTPIYTISGSPVTSAGTLTFTLSTETANRVFAGPTTGSAAQPGFRSLVAADIPAVSSVSVTQKTDNADYYLTFINNNTTGSYAVDVGTNLFYNPSTNLLTIGTGGSLVANLITGNIQMEGAGIITIQAVSGGVTTYNFNLPETAGTTGQLLTSGGGAGGAPMTWTSTSSLPQGTVTSVAMTVPTFLSIGGSPVTSSGTLAVTLSGTALPVANGGTGQVTAAAAFNALSSITTTGDMIYSPSGATSQRLAVGSTGNVLTVAGGVPTWAAPATSGTVTSTSVVTANNVTGTVATATTTPAITLAPNSATPAISSFASWDANKNLTANNLLAGYATTVTAAATTTLVVGSAEQQFFTGSTTQTVVLPVTSTLALGQQFIITNNSTGIITINSSGSNLVQSASAGTVTTATVILTSGTTAASWSVEVTSVGGSLSTFSIPNATDWTSFSMTITGTSSNPTKGTVTETAYSRRNGDSLEIQYSLIQTVAGTNGSGTYLFLLPSSLAIDTTKLPVSTDPNNTDCGFASVTANANVSNATGVVNAYDSTHLSLATLNVGGGGVASAIGSGSFGLNNGTMKYTFFARVPISGWTSNSSFTVGTPPTAAVSANTMYAGPSSGAAANPTFRTLVAADVAAGITGTTTNNNAAAGVVGEYTSATGSVTSAASNNYGDVASVSLTAGDWDVTGIVGFTGGSVPVYGGCGISTTTGNSATGLSAGDTLVYCGVWVPGTSDNSATCPAVRMSLSGTTTVYLKYRSGFTTTPTIYGRISARRIR